MVRDPRGDQGPRGAPVRADWRDQRHLDLSLGRCGSGQHGENDWPPGVQVHDCSGATAAFGSAPPRPEGRAPRAGGQGRPRETLAGLAVVPYGEVSEAFPSVNLTAGAHPLELAVDPDHTVQLREEQNTSASKQATCTKS